MPELIVLFFVARQSALCIKMLKGSDNNFGGFYCSLYRSCESVSKSFTEVIKRLCTTQQLFLSSEAPLWIHCSKPDTASNIKCEVRGCRHRLSKHPGISILPVQRGASGPMRASCV